VEKAFKMACLSYRPNKCTHRDEIYSRRDLLDKKEMILQKIN
jgi:hypothetical protein